MASLELPVRHDLPAYEFQIDLEGTVYTLSFTFNTRMNAWVMSIGDVNKEPLLNGVKLLTGWLPLRQYANTKLPPGKFAVIDTTESGDNPNLDNFGEGVVLMYEESA